MRIEWGPEETAVLDQLIAVLELEQSEEPETVLDNHLRLFGAVSLRALRYYKAHGEAMAKRTGWASGVAVHGAEPHQLSLRGATLQGPVAALKADRVADTEEKAQQPICTCNVKWLPKDYPCKVHPQRGGVP